MSKLQPDRKKNTQIQWRSLDFRVEEEQPLYYLYLNIKKNYLRHFKSLPIKIECNFCKYLFHKICNIYHLYKNS